MTDKKIRVTVVGDGDTGKTCMLIVYKDRKFDDRYIPTVFDVYSMTIPINDKAYEVILSDTAGQEEFDKLRKFAYKHVDCFIVTYAINERNSFENVSLKWAPELRRFAPNAKIILVGTKRDLRNEFFGHVSFEEGERLAYRIGANGFIENSSKELYNVDETFGMAYNAALFDRNFLKPKRVSTCNCL